MFATFHMTKNIFSIQAHIVPRQLLELPVSGEYIVKIIVK